MQQTLVKDLLQDIPAGVSIVDRPEDLVGFHRPGCAAAIWHRRPLASFQSWIDGLSPETLPNARVILRPADVRDAVLQICDVNGTPDCAERTCLIDNIAALADMFAAQMQAKLLRLRLDVVTTNACRKFHTDVVTARLVCTYRGTGTQYGIGVDSGDPRRIFTVPTGAPILMRGTLWPAQPRSGLLHRSPPIEGSGETRLVLVLDPVTEPENEI
ncbi:DUF1826 domain-containing protein [Aliiroseovarius sp. Z3]|uniref:DUF1826 domain-containing protein n=1 Tax=Aliiroseovarius sp. Z3 TaxID=2811402 RepID=UPI0023B26E6E|nr:DUF1826 domain-containing protein [Aliiroseovarius sp. Z3]MDE9450293.1 DUF1826 domain-containing protein [Aliiroseovarius sp. Z3]